VILVCNRETKDKIPERFKSKVQYFPVTGIGSDVLNLSHEGRKDQEIFRVITTGRLVHWKNFAEALKAFHLFSKSHEESQFFIVGDGPEKDRLLALSAGLNLEDKVRFISWLPQDELFEKMSKSDVFLYPSLREGGGAVVIEAMASGLPVICLDAAGPGFHIRKDWGVKIEPKDPGYVVDKMAAALKMFYRDEKLRREMGRKAFERAKDYYLWERLGERLQEIYNHVLKSDRN
jgi:glycosyltransferase involved in cell wall biosynthesis